MARRFAANDVARAVYDLVNVPAVTALAQGGVTRSVRALQPPYVRIGPCREESWDGFGVAGYGSVVDVPVHVITSGEDEHGDDRGHDISAAVYALVAPYEIAPASLGVPDWTVRQVEWVGNVAQPVQFLDDRVGVETALTFRVSVENAT